MKVHGLALLFATYSVGALSGGLLFGDEGVDEVRFDTDIRPILSDYCFACHGPDSEAREADLRFDLREEAMASGVIVPGKPDESELIARILSEDPDDRMPPPDGPKQLDAEQKELLVRWIKSGAEWQEHWAFVTPKRPKVPEPSEADAKTSWARNAVDRIVLEKLNELGLQPNVEADRHTLARRAALDLTGLPPTRAMLEEFVTDTADDAYERYVERLLASPQAGEHRARFWLDAARYGDTHGMHVDNYREMWPYRDWVINAFNTNMPFDQFVVEQIAGDLLPKRTVKQQVATGFNRCNISTAEGGAIIEEVNVRYMVDRVETTATVFLGLTAGCAVCHNHKYDPISQKEFYQLGAFFNNTTQPAMDGNQKDPPPVIALPGAEFESEWNALKERRNALRSELDGRNSAASAWWTSHRSDEQHPTATDDLALFLKLVEGEADGVDLPEGATWATAHPTGRRGMRFGDNGTQVEFPQIRSDAPLSVSFWYRSPDRVMKSTIFEQTVKIKGEDDKEKQLGWSIAGDTQGGVRATVFDGKGGRIEGHRPGEVALRPRSWQHVCVRYSGGQASSSISILIDGEDAMLRKAAEDHIAAVDLAEAPLTIGGSMPTSGLSDVRVFRRWLDDDEVRLLAKEFEVKELLESKNAWNELEAPQRQQLVRFHDHVIDDDYRGRVRELAKTETRRDYIYARSTTTLVMEERPTPPRAWVLERGEYDKRREEVVPDTPAVLPPLVTGESSDTRKDRLALARWLVRPDHPLTARVTVNRFWQSIFGTGLVKTSEDFGVMGERPSNQKLLDWLAVEFIESGWDVRHLLRLMVTSSAYRQSGFVTPEKVEKDPENRFLARGPRLRLDAEVLRDQALAVSGLLRRDVGGPSVRPYQPGGLWSVVAIVGSNTGKFKQDSGDALYRRSLYTFWKRTSPPPSMAAFNAPTREQCTVRRERTNTPLQALVLMNDPQYVEAARHLAQNGLRGYADDRARAAWMLNTVLSSPVDGDDLNDVLAAADEFRAIFAKDTEAAKKLLETGDSPADASLDASELAAWTLVANTLMNRDDFINKN